MTHQEEQLKSLMDNFNWNEQNIPVELVMSLVELRRKLLSIKDPIFTENGKSVMDFWEEFKYTGLSNVDYVTTKYYECELE